MPKETKVTFENLFAEGDEFNVGERKYVVLPLILTDAVKFAKESLYAYKSMAYIIDAEGPMRERVDYWLKQAVRTDKNEPVTVEMVEEAKWTTKDLRKCLQMIGELSG